ncbi:MAG: phasin family protein [Acidobacteriota bacterium]
MNTRETITHRMNRVRTEVKEAGRSAWLVGLGAFGTVEDQGRTLFTDLVDRGRKVGDDDLLARPWNMARQRAERLGDEVEQRMTGALHRLGIPARDDVQELTRRVQQLTAKVEGLAKA